METINIGDSDEKADWIKLVDGGKHKRREQAIFEAMQKEYRDATKKDTPTPTDGDK